MQALLTDYISAALGKRKLTLLIHDVSLLNVFTGEIYETSIGIYRDKIVYVGPSDPQHESLNTIEAEHKIAIPGLIDSHLHIESSMVTPSKFAAAALPHGLTTAFADPHEITNVMGREGLQAMIQDSRNLPMKIFFYVPTCVPESNAVTSGAELTPSDIDEILDRREIWGLGEVMDYPGVLNESDKMMRILDVGKKHNAVIDGHAPLLSNSELNGYITAGPEADHENFTAAEMVTKMRLGMYVKLRGPYILDPRKFVRRMKSIPNASNLILCTDDVMPDNLSKSGHLDYVCRSFIDAGMDPVDAVKSVTLTPAQHMRKNQLGAIAPGRTADIVLLDDLKKFNIQLVVAKGIPVAKDGKLLVHIKSKRIRTFAENTVKVRAIDLQDLYVHPPVAEGYVYVNAIDLSKFSRGTRDSGEIFLNLLLTKLGKAKVKVSKGQLVLGETALVFVFERHGKGGGRGLGFVRNLMKSGAIATTVAHDSHNLLVVGTDLKDMQIAANLVIESHGGIAAVQKQQTLAWIKLPIAGLMSDQSLEHVSNEMLALRRAFKKMGAIDHPYMPIVCLLALSVIPHARITDKGIFDVDNQKFVEPFVR